MFPRASLKTVSVKFPNKLSRYLESFFVVFFVNPIVRLLFPLDKYAIFAISKMNNNVFIGIYSMIVIIIRQKKILENMQ